MGDRLVSVADVKRAVERNCDMQDLYLPIHFFQILDEVPSRAVIDTKVIQNGANCQSFEINGGNMTINMRTR